MNDREMLELAAKAAGIVFSFRQGVPCRYEQPKTSKTSFSALGWKMWNPLEDDGEVFRLAVKLGISIRYGYCMDDAPVVFVKDEFMEEELMFENFPDSRKATRRAIVRAAAEIGKGMR